MQMRQPRYSKRGTCTAWDEIWHQTRPSTRRSCNQGKIVAIDVETGAFEMAEDTLTAAQRCSPITPMPRFGASDRPPWGPSFGWSRRWGTWHPMITGMVNANREAIIQLMALGPQGHVKQEIEAVIDTGFYRFFDDAILHFVAALGLTLAAVNPAFWQMVVSSSLMCTSLR